MFLYPRGGVGTSVWGVGQVAVRTGQTAGGGRCGLGNDKLLIRIMNIAFIHEKYVKFVLI